MVPKIKAVAMVTARVKSSRWPLRETSRGMVVAAVGDHAQKEAVGDRGQRDAERAAGEGENKAFGEQLANDAGASRSESLADGEFAGARGGAGEQQVGDVGAGDEQYQCHDRHEDLEWLGELRADRR